MQRTNVKANTVFNTIKTIFGIIYPLITFPYISRVLMAENVGKVNFGSSIVSYFSLIASLGVTTYAVRECSKIRDDREQLGKISSQILSINMGSTLVAYVALAVTLIVADSLENYRTLICIQSTAILFTTLGADWLNTAMEDFKFIAIRTVGMQIFSLVLLFVFVRKPEDYIVYSIISVVAASGANVINVFYRRKFCKTMLTVHMNLRKHLPSILLLFTMIFSQIIYTNSDTTMLGLIRGDFEVGLYSTAVKIYQLVNTVIASVAWVVMPQLSAGFAEHDYKKVNLLLKYSLNFIIVLGMPCIIGVNVIGKQIISIIAGEQYLGATTALHILTCTLFFSLIGGWIGNMTILPAGREKVCLFSCSISALVNIILNFFLIPYFGLNAAASTTAIAECVGVIVMSRYLDKNIQIDDFKEMMKAPLVGCVGIILVSVLVKVTFTSDILIALFTISGSAIVYGLVLLVLKNEFALGFLQPMINKMKRG